MTDADEDHIMAAMQANSDVGRGDVYRWLKKNRRKIQVGFKATGSGWNGVVAALAEESVVGKDGRKPNRKTVQQTWARLCRDLAAASLARATAISTREPAHRSRPSSNWEPPLSNRRREAPVLLPRRYEPEQQLSPRPPSPIPPSQAPHGNSKMVPLDEIPPEVRVKLDRVRQQLLEDDYKKNGRP